MYYMSIHGVVPTLWIDFLLRENSVELTRDAPSFCQLCQHFDPVFPVSTVPLVVNSLPSKSDPWCEARKGQGPISSFPKYEWTQLRDSHGFWRDSFFPTASSQPSLEFGAGQNARFNLRELAYNLCHNYSTLHTPCWMQMLMQCNAMQQLHCNGG